MPLLLVSCGVAVCAPLGAQGLGAQGRAPNTCFWISLLGPRRGENRHFRGGGAPPRRHAVSRGGRVQLGRHRRYFSIRVARAPSQRQIGQRGGGGWDGSGVTFQFVLRGPLLGDKLGQGGVQLGRQRRYFSIRVARAPSGWQIGPSGGAVRTAAALLDNSCC